VTRARTPKPTAPPLATAIRAALAQGWTTLATLDALAAPRKGARAAVHAALRALAVEGVKVEERVSAGGVEVRALWAPVETLTTTAPGDGLDALCPSCRYPMVAHPPAPAPCPFPSTLAGRMVLPSFDELIAGTVPAHGTPEYAAWFEARRVALGVPTPALDSPAPPVGHAAPVERVGGPGAPQPGPSSRCAVCGEQYRTHGTRCATADSPFTPKPRGRPRVTPVAAPFRSHATPETRAMLDAVCDEADERLAAVQATDPDVEEPPSPAEQKAILDGAKRDYEAAVAGQGAPAEPETSRGGSEETPSGAAQGFADTLRKAFPDAFKPEIIDGADVATVAREMVDLTIAFSPVVARRDSIDAVGVTPLDNGRFRVDALWETTGLPMEVDAAGLAVMRARYLLLRGLLTRSLSSMDYDTHRAVVRRFFQGVEPWAPAPRSPLARMGAGPLTITVPDGVGIEGIDWTALMGALAGEGGEVPAVVPVRPLGPPLPPAPPPEPPAAHVLEGEHSRACGYWKVHDPAHCDPAKLAAEIKICRACWGKMYALGGGRPRVEDERKYVGDRYV